MSMSPRQPLDASQLAAVARLFSSGVLQEVARRGKSPLFSRLARESGLAGAIPLAEPVRNLFDLAFSVLKRKCYRHEYVYKAAITHKILLGAHSLQTAAMLTEFRVGKCKADIAILNGTSTVYEIKSERDKLDRLNTQVHAYRQAFAKVNVITGENHLKSVLANVPSDVGVLLLTNRYQISTVREAVDAPERIIPGVIFDSLQMHEAKKILVSLGFVVPKVPNTQIYQSLREQFVKLAPYEAHAGMVKVLKDTRSLKPLADLVDALPESLRAAAFSTPLRQQNYARLASAMDVPLREALNWA